MTRPRGTPLVDRLHQTALRAYPSAFRARLGADLHDTFLQRLRRAHRPGRRLAVVAAGLIDTVLSGLAERRADARVARQQPHLTSDRSLILTWESLRSDLRLAFQQMRRAPTFAALVIATLAIGIGANSAIFSTVHAVLLKPLPYDAPDRLVSIWSHQTKIGDPNYAVSPANYDAFARESTAFTHLEAMYSFLTTMQVANGDTSEPVQVSWVTSRMFGLLGRQPLLGRGLQDADEQAVVLSHGYWMRRFGGDRDIVGKTVPRPGDAPPYTVVGVMPEDFVFPYRSMLAPSGFSRAQQPDLWLLLTPRTGFRMVDAAGQPSRTIHFLSLVGRMKAGISIEQAHADLASIAARRAQDFPDSNDGFGVTLRPLIEQTVGSVKPALVLLTAGVGVLLMLTCVNIANVLLARATGRQRDAAVRAALGATRARLLQQSLVESGVLGLLGGVAALGLVAAGTGALLGLAPADLPRLSETRLSGTVIAFTFLTALAAGLLTGLLPAWAATRAKAAESLRESRRTTGGRTQRAVRSSLVVAEIALATLLTVGAGLLLRSFVSVLSVDPGFEPDHLLTFQVGAPPRYAGTANLIRFYDELRDKLNAIPGVTHVGGSTRIPLGSTQVSTQLSVEGRDLPPADLPEVQMRRAVHDYFGTMRIPVIEGRVFTDADRTAAEPLAVINKALADQVFPEGSPVGRRVQMGGQTRPDGWLRIVGVVGNIKHSSLEEASMPELYISHLQGPPTSPFMAVRTTGDPAALTSAVRAAVRSLGAEAPTAVMTMNQLRSEAVGARRFVVWLTAAFGMVALVLAAVGVYGVIALLVSERTTEVGVRLALGASPRQVWSMLVRQASLRAALGVAIGLAAAGLAAPLAAGQLFGITAGDPLTYLGVGCLLLAVAIVAAALPARRAMGVDPATALRAQ